MNRKPGMFTREEFNALLGGFITGFVFGTFLVAVITSFLLS